MLWVLWNAKIFCYRNFNKRKQSWTIHKREIFLNSLNSYSRVSFSYFSMKKTCHNEPPFTHSVENFLWRKHFAILVQAVSFAKYKARINRTEILFHLLDGSLFNEQPRMTSGVQERSPLQAMLKHCLQGGAQPKKVKGNIVIFPQLFHI